jgi:hypothetical protein
MARAILIQGSIVRGLYGVLALLAPHLLTSATPGMDEDDFHEDARYFNRLFGGRDLLVAAATVAAVRPSGPTREALAANIFCELTDSISLAEEVRKRGKFDRVTIIGALFNIVGYATWLRAARALQRSKPAGGELGPPDRS